MVDLTQIKPESPGQEIEKYYNSDLCCRNDASDAYSNIYDLEEFNDDVNVNLLTKRFKYIIGYGCSTSSRSN